MRSSPASYHGYRFSPDIISHAVGLSHRFCRSFRAAEDLLAQRGVTVTSETIRPWDQRFGPVYARRLQRRAYAAAGRTVMPSVVHVTDQDANTRAEVSHHPTRPRERQMRRFTSAAQLQRVASAHHRLLRTRAFVEWNAVTCAC